MTLKKPAYEGPKTIITPLVVRDRILQTSFDGDNSTENINDDDCVDL